VRGDVVEVAAELGIHVYGEKPLAMTAAEAHRMYRCAMGAGIKHAYAATLRYDPGTVWLGELARSGTIGTVRGIEYSFSFSWPALTPWGWWDQLATGGGLLNNWLSHVLAMLSTITGGELLRVMGEARVGRSRAPFVGELHDMRAVWRPEECPTAEQAARLEWRPCDADDAFSALLVYSLDGGEVPITLVSRSACAAPWPPDGWRVYGDAGTLLLESNALYRLASPSGEREVLPVPQRLLEQLPSTGEDGSVDLWAALARDFVAHIQGASHQPYLTFRDGWRYQEAIEAIRSGRGWHELPV
jgi:predicted dehydrogenase